ncbi:hypothetical protein D9M73_112500 [compost metagenome]
MQDDAARIVELGNRQRGLGGPDDLSTGEHIEFCQPAQYQIGSLLVPGRIHLAGRQKCLVGQVGTAPERAERARLIGGQERGQQPLREVERLACTNRKPRRVKKRGLAHATIREQVIDGSRSIGADIKRAEPGRLEEVQPDMRRSRVVVGAEADVGCNQSEGAAASEAVAPDRSAGDVHGRAGIRDKLRQNEAAC